MKRALFVCFSFILVAFMLCSFVLPSPRFLYIHCSTEELGNVYLLFGNGYSTDSLVYSSIDKAIFNVSSSTCTGYIYESSDYSYPSYTITVRPIGSVGSNTYEGGFALQYRAYSGGGSYARLTITEILDSNMNLDSEFNFNSATILYSILAILILFAFFHFVSRR